MASEQDEKGWGQAQAVKSSKFDSAMDQPYYSPSKLSIVDEGSYISAPPSAPPVGGGAAVPPPSPYEPQTHIAGSEREGWELCKVDGELMIRTLFGVCELKRVMKDYYGWVHKKADSIAMEV